MKLLRSIWVSLVNVVLLFLPLVLLVVFVVQFGQPIVELYREYFLGNPAQELIQATESLEQNSGTRVPFDRLRRQFDGVQTMETISDTELQGVQKSIVRVHGAVVSRLGSGDLLAVVDSYSDSYSRVLNHSLLDEVFERPDLVRQKLTDDLQRIRKLPKLPSHPVKGLDAFWANSDTAARIVEEYGSIYANQVACKQVFKVKCGTVYDDSVELSSEYLNQYLSNWPEISSQLASDPAVFSNRAPALIQHYFEFTGSLEGYFQAKPWIRFKSLLRTFEGYKESYRSGLAGWYASIIEEFSLDARDFSKRKWSKDFSALESLRAVEGDLQQQERLRDVVLTESNRNLREELLRRLGNLYIEINALDQFESGYDLSPEGLQSLEVTIEAFPNGEKRLSQRNQKLNETRELFNEMQTAIRDKRYSDLKNSLQTVDQRLESGRNSTLWNIMGTKFLLSTREQITTPGWQPTTGQAHEDYRDIVRFYGQIGSRLGLQSLSEDWVEQTLIALKSRRFNQLKHSVLKKIEDFTSGEVDRIINLLTEIQQINDLPDDLSSRADEMLYEVALVERLQLESSRVYRAFSDQLETRTRFRSGWSEFNKLVSVVESDSPSRFLENRRLKDYVSRWGDWLNTYTNGSSFDELILKHARETLLGFVGTLVENFKVAVRNPARVSRSEDQLLEGYDNISNGLKLIQKLPGVDEKYALERWRNVILVRRDFEAILKNINNLKKGSLWGDNESFNRYKNQLDNFEWLAIPLRYDAEREIDLIRRVTGSLERKAIELKEASKDDWLSGWGGRVRPGQILEPWVDFLDGLEQTTRHPEIASVATAMKQETEQNLEELSS